MKVDEVKALGRALLLSRANVNNCSTLLSLLSSPRAAPNCLAEAIRCLQAFFLPTVEADPGYFTMQPTTEAGDAEGIYRAWLKSKYEEFLQVLTKLAVESSKSKVLEVALDAFMELIRVGSFNKMAYFDLVSSLLDTAESGVVDILVANYFQDKNIRDATLEILRKLILQRLGKKRKAEGGVRKDDNEQPSMEIFVSTLYEILSKLSSFIQEHEQSKAQKTTDKSAMEASEVKDFKRGMKVMWLNFLQLQIPLDLYKQVLTDMSKVIVSSMSTPVRLSDFLIKSYDIGGLFSIMALDGLFILMTKHALEYPEFYDKLYALLEPSMFFTKYRARFFELMDTCLQSPLLPAYLAAAFAKKLSRLSLSVSPAGSLLIIAMIHNLLRRHPSINSLVHQHSRIKDSEEPSKEQPDPGADPFRPNEPKTSECNALKSSLWEIESLRRHYCPAVSRFVASLEVDLTVRAKTSEVRISDFSSGSYSTIFHEESRRRLKQVPLAYYKVTPSTLFPAAVESDGDFNGWSFNENALSNKRRRL